VVLYGVKVGAVSAISLNEDPTKGVQVEFTVEKRYKIPVDSKAKIFSDGIMGGKAIEIDYGVMPDYIPKGGTIETEQSADLFDMAGTEIDFLNEKIAAVVDGLTVTLDGVNKLLAANTESLTSIMENVNGVTGNVNAMLAKERAHLEQALESLSKFSKSLGDNSEQVGGIIDNLNKFSGQLVEADLVAELEHLVGEINGILASVKDENGSVGKLLNDGNLYNNLTTASDNLSTLLADLKENPHRYINIAVFGSNPTKKVEKAKAKVEKKAIKRADELAEKQHEQQMKELEQAE
jgi:phospholipid/cholesterol/gamma-HCH transport system substrate-binding protein